MTSNLPIVSNTHTKNKYAYDDNYWIQIMDERIYQKITVPPSKKTLGADYYLMTTQEYEDLKTVYVPTTLFDQRGPHGYNNIKALDSTEACYFYNTAKNLGIDIWEDIHSNIITGKTVFPRDNKILETKVDSTLEVILRDISCTEEEYHVLEKYCMDRYIYDLRTIELLLTVPVFKRALSIEQKGLIELCELKIKQKMWDDMTENAKNTPVKTSKKGPTYIGPLGLGGPNYIGPFGPSENENGCVIC